MRRTLILAILALAISAALCAAGAMSVSRAVAAAEDYRQRAEASLRRGDADAALEHLRALEDDWAKRGRVLELITAHDALSDVRAVIADARVCLENGDTGEFFRVSTALEAALTRMRETEAIRIINLF